MQYMILIYGDEQAWAKMPEADRARAFTAFMQYNKDLAASGALRAGDQLQPSRSTKKLRMNAGKVEVTDGPFAETREQLGGYYVVETETEQAALDLAGKCPAIYGGVIEVRPLIPNPRG